MTRPRPARKPPARWLAGLVVAVSAGAICSAIGTPIPWMLGPLFAIAALRVAGFGVAAPPGARYVGQWIIGTSLGLYFTPSALAGVAGSWHVIVAATFFAIVVGYVCGLLLARLAGIDRTTGVFASVPGGAAEMATLGERFGARADRVAAAHSLRMLMVVAIVPAVFALADVHGADRFVAGTQKFDAGGLALLMAATLIGCGVFQLVRAPNAFVLGSLAVAIPLAATEVDLSAMPTVLSNAGQCLLGSALGARFQPDFLRGAPRFVGATVVSVLLAIALSAVFAVALAWATEQNAATLVLGTAPGGIAEMCITAKVLQLGVPLVTACHVTRVVVLLLATAPLFGTLRNWWRAHAKDD